MTYEEALAYAKSILDGAPIKKAEVVAAIKAYSAYMEANPPPMKRELDGQDLPYLPFEIEKTDSGIHVPREANRAFSKREGYALVAMLLKALE